MIAYDTAVNTLLKMFRPVHRTTDRLPAGIGRPFVTLPAEIRNQIYEECLVSDRAIDLTALRRCETLAPQRQSYGLTARLLVACKQVYAEALPILYGQNLFYYDLESMWSYHRPQAWRRCFHVELDALYACLKCQMYQDLNHKIDTPALDMTPQGDDMWNPNLSFVRRLQVSLVPYTYLEWRYRHCTAFPRQHFTCPHSVRYSMPSKLQVDLLVVRIGSRALMDPEECINRQNWYRVASRYESRDAHTWRSRSERDEVRDLSRLVEYARCHARSIVLAGIDSTSHFESRPRK